MAELQDGRTEWPLGFTGHAGTGARRNEGQTGHFQGCSGRQAGEGMGPGVIRDVKRQAWTGRAAKVPEAVRCVPPGGKSEKGQSL